MHHALWHTGAAAWLEDHAWDGAVRGGPGWRIARMWRLGGGGTSNPGTTAGTYTITVTGASGAPTETGTVTLTVQQA